VIYTALKSAKKAALSHGEPRDAAVILIGQRTCQSLQRHRGVFSSLWVDRLNVGAGPSQNLKPWTYFRSIPFPTCVFRVPQRHRQTDRTTYRRI